MIASPDAAGLGVPAPLARDPRDLAGWAEIVLGALPGLDPQPVRACWSGDLGYAGAELDPAVVATAHDAARRLVASAGLRWTPGVVELLDPAPAWLALRDPHAVPVARARATALRHENDRRLAEAFTRCDLLFTPTTPGPPHGHDGPGPHMNVALTWVFNLSGHPAISVPAGRTSTGPRSGHKSSADPALIVRYSTSPPSCPRPPPHP